MQRKLHYILISGITLMMANAYAILPDAQIKIEGPEAKYIYNAMRGSDVENEGAAGHFYRHGKSVLCRYVNADMDDAHGKPMGRNDARRFACVLTFDKNGLAAPGKF